jgi:hypothetical protein
MKQGTKSVLIGCHSVVHPMVVIAAWHKLYGRWPAWWQVVCIFIHDIGIAGRDYLNKPEQKVGHWKRGAKYAWILFGKKGYNLVAGHTSESGYPQSELYKPDKVSHMIAPRWWQLVVAKWLEPEIHASEYAQGLTPGECVDLWRARVKVNIESGRFVDNHKLYIEKEAEFRNRG